MDEKKGRLGGGHDGMLIAARIVLTVAAIGLVAAFFLPWASADDAYREAAAQAPEIVVYEGTGITAAQAADLSLLEFAQIYGSMEGAWTMYMYLMYALLGISAVSLVCAAAGKPVVTSVFALLACALSRLLVWDFEDRGALPNATYDWGIAPAIYLGATVAIVVIAIWMVVMRRKEKAVKVTVGA